MCVCSVPFVFVEQVYAVLPFVISPFYSSRLLQKRRQFQSVMLRSGMQPRVVLDSPRQRHCHSAVSLKMCRTNLPRLNEAVSNCKQS